MLHSAAPALEPGFLDNNESKLGAPWSGFDVTSTGDSGNADDTRLRLLCAALRRLGDEVHNLDMRQMVFDGTLVQVQRQLKGIVTDQEFYGSRLAQLSTACDGWPQKLGDRITALERGQKAVAAGAQRALRTALAAKQEQSECIARLEELRVMGSHCPRDTDSGSASDSTMATHTDEQLAHKFDDQDRRLAALDNAVAAMTQQLSNFRLDKAGNTETALDESDFLTLRKRFDAQAEALSELQEQMEELLARSDCTRMSTSQQSGRVKGQDTDNIFTADAWNVNCETLSAERQWAMFAQNYEAQFGSAVAEIRRRIDALQQLVDERVLSDLWQLTKQVPEATSRVDRISSQCQECLAKTEAHEVRIDLVRTSFEAHEQKFQALADRVDRTLSSEQEKQIVPNVPATEIGAVIGRIEAQARSLEELREQLQDLSCTRAQTCARIPFVAKGFATPASASRCSSPRSSPNTLFSYKQAREPEGFAEQLKDTVSMAPREHLGFHKADC